MRRNKVITREDWLVPENNKGKKWKFNKNVSVSEKKKFRAKTFRQNVELIVT